MERLEGVLLDDVLGGSLDPDEGFFGCHVAHHLGVEQLDEALVGSLHVVLVIAALQPIPAQWASLECGAVCANCLSKLGGLRPGDFSENTSRFDFLIENVNKF